MQLTRPFRKGRYRPDKGSTARSYQNPRLAGQAFPMLFAQGKKKKKRKKKKVVEKELGRGRKAEPGRRGRHQE